MTTALAYDELRDRAARYLALPDLPPHLRYSEDQERDENGRFGSGGGGGSSSSDDDESIYGYGRDSNGVPYTENDVDLGTGEPKFSQAYRDKYGPIDRDNQMGRTDIHVVATERGGIHIADDSNGSMSREVVQDLSKRDAGQLGDAVWDVYNGDKDSVRTRSGIEVTPNGDNPTSSGVRVQWSSGRVDTLEGEAGDDAAFELQETLRAYNKTRSARERTYGRAILSPYPSVRAAVERAFSLPDLPPRLRYSDDQERDENGRFGSGGGGGGSARPAGGAALHAGDEAAVKAAYEFDDDELTGLRTEVYAIRSAGPNQTTYVSAWIKDGNGEIVGQAEHAILPDGRTARLDGLILEPDYQGQGFGARYMRSVETSYREAGVEEIHLTADIDVGGYSWAKDGYNFQTSDARSRVASMAREESRRFTPDVQRQVRAVADDPEATPLDFAMIGWQEGISTWPGKQIMLGSLWEGSKRL